MYEIKNKEIILASASSKRRDMLQNANIGFKSQTAHIDEEAIRQSALSEGVSLADCATLLAEIKGRRIAVANPNAFIIASDQLLDFDGRCFSKPESLDKAKIQNRPLASRNFLHQPVMPNIDHIVLGSTDAAEDIHNNGFFTGNGGVPIKEEITKMYDIISGFVK